MKKKTFLLFLLLCSSVVMHAQESIRIIGNVTDETTGESLPDVSVSIENSAYSTTTNNTGSFSFSNPEIPLGEHVITFQKEGFITKRYPIVSNEGEQINLSLIEMKVDITEENLQINTISLSDNELDNDDSSFASSSGLLQASRDTYLNAAAFDFSATFFRPRGYDNANGKVLINGIEMNKQFDGRPQWSSWGGLNDSQRNQVFSMGISANDYTFGGVAGTTNIIMRASQYQKGGRVSYASSNRSYTGRVMASYNTGMMEDGWALSFLASRRFADEGFRKGTLYDANSFFASVEKQLSEKHSLNLSAFYTPNRRGKSTAITQEVKELKGAEYNPLWGYQDGDIRNSRNKEIQEPVIMLNHYWDISENTQLNTNLAYQFGKIGNTRIDNGGTQLIYDSDGNPSYIGGARNPTPEYYQNLPSYHLRFPDLNPGNYQSAYEAQQSFVSDGQLNWNSLYDANVNARNGQNSIYVLQEDRQDDTQLTANTILTSKINENITLNGTLNYRHLLSENFAELKDLLGGSGYLDVDFFAEESQDINSTLNDLAQSDINNPNRIATEGERYKYNYEVEANVASAFAQTQFEYNDIDFFVGANVENTSYQRNGLYENGYFVGNSFGKSEKLNFTNYGAKGGLTYKGFGRHIINVNAGYYTKAPSIRNSFSNARQNNNVVIGLESEKIQSIDASYIFRTPTIKARVTGFYTGFQDGTDIGFYFTQDLSGFGLDNGDAFVQEVVNNIDRRNMGVEFGAEAQVTSTIKLKAAGSYGQNVYTNNPDLYLTSDDFSEPKTFGEGKTYLKDYHVAGGPEKAFQLGFEYRDPEYWWFGATANYFDDAYIDPSTLQRSANFPLDYDGLPINDYNPERAKELLRQENFGDYMLVNLVGGKSWKIDNYFVGFFATVNNVFNKEYKTGGFEQSRNSNYRTLNEDQSRENGSLFGNRYFYGYGTTYYLNVYVRF